MHPAWARLAVDPAAAAEPGRAGRAAEGRLAWRRAACRDPDACAPSEKACGGLLELLKSKLPLVPEGTRGTLNAYLRHIDELSAAVRAQLATTDDAFYSSCPLTTLNYGGRGGSQQLWWCGDRHGWRASPRNIHSGVTRVRPRDAIETMVGGGATPSGNSKHARGPRALTATTNFSRSETHTSSQK